MGISSYPTNGVSAMSRCDVSVFFSFSFFVFGGGGGSGVGVGVGSVWAICFLL